MRYFAHSSPPLISLVNIVFILFSVSKTFSSVVGKFERSNPITTLIRNVHECDNNNKCNPSSYIILYGNTRIFYYQLELLTPTTHSCLESCLVPTSWRSSTTWWYFYFRHECHLIITRVIHTIFVTHSTFTYFEIHEIASSYFADQNKVCIEGVISLLNTQVLPPHCLLFSTWTAIGYRRWHHQHKHVMVIRSLLTSFTHVQKHFQSFTSNKFSWIRYPWCPQIVLNWYLVNDVRQSFFMFWSSFSRPWEFVVCDLNDVMTLCTFGGIHLFDPL